jgi:hypothetical protein
MGYHPEDLIGLYIMWEYYGYEGWHPKSYPDLASAITAQRFNSEWEITKKVEFKVLESGKV